MRRGLKIAGLVLATLILLVLLVGVSVRLYYSDSRLRDMAQAQLSERLATQVEIETLDASLFSGVVVGPTRIGPLPGFEADTFAFRRLAVRWSLFDLLRLRLTIDELALEGIEVAVEENETGRNIDALRAALAGPAAPEAETDEPEEANPDEQPPAEKKPLVQPSLPLRVDVDRIAFSVDSARVLRPDMQVTIDRIGVDGRFSGEGQAMDLELWVGLGERQAEGASSRLTVQGAGLPGDLTVDQRLGLAVASSGLGDVKLAFDMSSLAEITGERPVPPVTLGADVDIAVDLLSQELSLKPCSISLGEQTRFDMTAMASALLSEPELRVERMTLVSVLAELQPLVAAFVEGARLSGTVSIDSEPFVLSLASGAAARTAASVTVRLEQLAASMAGSQFDALDGTIVLASDGRTATVTVDTTMPRASGAGQTVSDLQAGLQVTTPLGPWIGGEVAGEVSTTLTTSVGYAGSPKGWSRGLMLAVEAKTPIALIKKQPTEERIDATMRLQLGSAGAPQGGARGIDVRLRSQMADLKGSVLDAGLDFRVRQATASLGEEVMQIDGIRLQLDAQRFGDRYVIHRLDLNAAEAIEAHVEGSIANATGPAPRFNAFVARLGPIDLAGALALLPASKRPPAEVAGSATLTWNVHGSVPHRYLLKRAMTPITIPPGKEGDAGAQLQAYADVARGWASYVAAGLPFETRVALVLKDVAFADENNEISGARIAHVFELATEGPRVSFAADIAEVTRPLQASALHYDLGVAFTETGLDVAMNGSAGRVERDDLPRPLDGASLELRLGYRIAGDLALDRFIVSAPDRGVNVEATGIISKPARFALTRGWQQPGMPGMDAALRWSARMNGGEPEPVSVGGPVIGGGIGLSGSLRAADGVVRLEGLFDSDSFNVAMGDLTVDELSGALPFDIALAFDPRPDATILRRGIGIGSGVVALLTSDTDISERPARPVFHDRLRPYRKRAGLTARRMRQGPYEIHDFELEGRLTEGMLLADWIAMSVLGGDVAGNLGFQLGRDSSVRSDIVFKVSNIDASYFEALKIEPGPASELSADMQFGFVFAPRRRDLVLNMNVTKIGSEALDRFLQLLDPDETDETMQKNRRNLGLVDINSVAAWIRYENFYMNLDASVLFRIPFTDIGFPNIDRELVPGLSLSDRLDELVQPHIDKYLAPNLGWEHAG